MTDAIDSTVAVYERLLAKAKESVVRDFAPDNALVDVLVMRAESLSSMGTEFHYCFKLNGRKHRDVARGFAYTQGGERVVRVEVRAAKARDGK